MIDNLRRLALSVQRVFPSFYLAGGTSVMLKYHHRTSIDLDFFHWKPFSFDRLRVKASREFDVSRWEKRVDNLDLFINDVKVSFVFFPFRNVERPQTVDGIVMASDLDLLLNKIYVAGRRVDRKDPIDAAALLARNSWRHEEIRNAFERKFEGQSFGVYLGALVDYESYGRLTRDARSRLDALRVSFMRSDTGMNTV